MNSQTESDSPDSSDNIKPAQTNNRSGNDNALWQSEESYRALFNSIDQGCYLAEVLFDARGNAIDVFYLDANPASVGLTGQDFKGKHLREINPAYEEYWYKIFGRVATTGQSERMQKFAATYEKLYDVYVFRIDSSMHRVGIIFQDITDRVRREANQAFLAKITYELSQFSTAEEIVAIVGEKIGDYLNIASCMFLDVDDERGEVTIFDTWNAPGTPSLRNQTHLLYNYVDKDFLRANRVGDVVVIRNTHTDSPGKDNGYSKFGIGAFISIPFHRHGVWTNYMAITDTQVRNWRPDEIELLRDLCNRIFPRLERARTEEKMRRLEDRTRIAIEAANLATWEWDLVTDQVYWNEQHFHLLGIPINEDTKLKPNEPLPSDAFMQHIHPEDFERIEADLTRAIKEKSLYDADFRIVRTDGTVRWMSGYGRITAESEGKATRFNGVMFDIHARKQAEEALIKADKNKDEFLATLAHELRNPLAPIRNMLQVLHLTAGENQTVNSAVDLMNRHVDQMVHLIDDLLDVSRISRGTIQLQLRQIDLNQVIQQAIETARPLYDTGRRTLSVNLPAAPLYMQADCTRLIQVVSNLLNNAAKFTYEGGTVELNVIQNQVEAVLTVHDNGIGIVEQDLERIFDLFTQSDASLEKSYGGLGLGLTLARQLVELHGGRITASSPGHDQGSTFTVYLPIATSSPENKINYGH